jgi:hypothetical protein
MKKSFLVSVLVCAASAAHAAQRMDVNEVFKSSATCVPISISSPVASAGVTNLLLGTSTNTYQYTGVYVQNLDTSTYLFVAETPNVWTLAGVAGKKRGAVIAPWTKPNQPNGMFFTLGPGMSWFAISDGQNGTGTTDAEVCKGY